MNVYVCTDHECFYPVGACSVVIAKSEDEARGLLQAALRERGLRKEESFSLQELNLEKPEAHILLDGDY